jgi:hypothetical protein
MYMRGGVRGIGQATPDYYTLSTSTGDYVVVTNAGGVAGQQQIIDPNGNQVSSIPGYPGSPGFPSASSASLFPGMTGSTTIAGVSVPSWLIPVGLAIFAVVMIKAAVK